MDDLDQHSFHEGKFVLSFLAWIGQQTRGTKAPANQDVILCALGFVWWPKLDSGWLCAVTIIAFGNTYSYIYMSL